MNGVLSRWCDVPVWVHVMGVNMDVFSNGFDSAGVKGTIWCVPGALLLGIGQVGVLSRGGSDMGWGGLVELVLEVVAVFEP